MKQKTPAQKKKMIAALTATINSLKNNKVHYAWSSMSSCNCGILAQNILKKTQQEIWAIQNAQLDTIWGNAALTCSSTGQKIPDILKRLFNTGFSAEDINEFEHLSNPDILKLSGIDTATYFKYYAKRENVILYCQAWIKILKKKPGLRPYQKEALKKLKAPIIVVTAKGAGKTNVNRKK